jgi:ADP-heptose:LPS heptosyltransferase
MADNILVIKLGALGDFVQAMGPFAAIRNHHADAKITLLTTGPYVELAHACGLFDRVWTDLKPRSLALSQWAGLRRQLRTGKFQRVYDLQTSDRSSFYRRLFWPGPNPQWSGIARGCSHPHANPKRDFMHTIERQAEQLKVAGIEQVPGPDSAAALAGLDGPVDQFNIKHDFAILVPGGAPHRPEKRWANENYSKLAEHLLEQGLVPVLLGGPAETEAMEMIAADHPEVKNLCGQTSLLDIAALARRARLAIGNDTGPMHLIAAMGCPSWVLYSQVSDPALCGQRGANVSFIRKRSLADLEVEKVVEKLDLA